MSGKRHTLSFEDVADLLLIASDVDAERYTSARLKSLIYKAKQVRAEKTFELFITPPKDPIYY